MKKDELENPTELSSTSRRDDVLSNYDLLTAIFSVDEQGNGRGTLLNAALVSRSFEGPALDCLWKSLDSFIPLLKLLPELELEESVYYYGGNIKVSSFPEYAKRVRSITLPVIKEKITFSGQLFSRLANQLAGSPLLPGLYKIRVEDLDTAAATLLPLLFSPSLHTLEFRKESLSRPHLHRSLFPSLKTDLPSVKRLIVEHDNLDFKLAESIPKMLLGMIGLQSLSIRLPGTPFYPEYISEIASSMPQLVDLSLDIKFAHTSTTTPFNGRNHTNEVCPATPAITKSTFPSLQSLHLTVRNGSTCHFNPSITICSAFSPAFLEHLTSLTVRISNPVSSIADLIQCLSRSPCFKRLELTQTVDDVASGAKVPLAVVLSIFEITTIEEVIVNVGNLGITTQEEGRGSLQKVVDAAYSGKPALLRTLALLSKSPHPSSIRDLSYVSQSAIGLESLSLAINSGIESFKEYPPLEQPVNTSSTLRHLEVSDIRPAKDFSLMEHSNIAQYLDTIFPNLETLRPYSDSKGTSGNHEDNWVFIEHLRKKVKSLRILSSV